mmetsp:Transcript_29426/g.57580  ORF Transcript_29426/g.57580 Transcript_29426/m.57580 type:complete len:236 (+) Transcript_29426:2333-3040(+)
MLQKAQGRFGADRAVRRALQAAHRERQRQGGPQDQIGAPILDQALGDDVRVHIIRGHGDLTIAGQRVLLGLGKGRPIAVFSKVGRGSDGDEACDTRGMGAGEKQRLPAAHGTAYDDQLAPGQTRQCGRCVFGPITDAPLFERARAFAVARIIKAQKSLAARATPRLKMDGFGTLHVGFQPAQKYNCRPVALCQMIGQSSPLRRLEILHATHNCPPRSRGSCAGATALSILPQRHF